MEGKKICYNDWVSLNSLIIQRFNIFDDNVCDR